MMLPDKIDKSDIKEQVLVKDVMSKPVMTVEEGTSADRVAQLIERHRVGCLMVVGEGEKPLGIITERDLATRIVAKDLQPSKVHAEDVMTSPLITINPNETITEAARRMGRLNIRRLGVLPKGATKLIGIITSRDILKVMPELIEIVLEKKKIAEATLADFSEHLAMTGYCERCGNWSGNLKESNGDFLCEECID
jgi:predicted transcriptional regulator